MVARTGRIVLLLFFVMVLGCLLGHSILAEKEPGSDQALLGGGQRFLTHVSTDKPIYRPGETVYVRGVVLHAQTRKPLPPSQRVMGQIQVTGPKGDIQAGGWTAIQDSVLGFSWPIPNDHAGGQYTVKISYPQAGHTPAERTFDIRAYRAPRLKSQIEFVRKGYGPGDSVMASLQTERAEGGFPVNARVRIQARVDGQTVYSGTTQVDENGRCSTRFPLPQEIRRGEGSLAFIIEDGGVVETASKTIPILLQTVDLHVYPEGGDLLAGVPNRVYFEARLPNRKPADLAGLVVDDQNRRVATFRSRHEGRGRFEFTPKPNRQYKLKITEPAGLDREFPLPDVRVQGVVLRSSSDRFTANQPIRVQVAAANSQKVTVVLSQREVELSRVTRQLKAKQFSDIEMAPPADAAGVLRVTVWHDDKIPLAERLVFRKPAKPVRVQLSLDRSSYTPGSRARVTIKTTTSDGEPLSAVVGLTVTDDSILEMIDKREQAPRLPMMVLFEDDVRELADAHVYLDEHNPVAPRAIDLLLGTQGWRRFAFVDPVKFLEAHGDPAGRVLALRMGGQRQALASDRFGNGLPERIEEAEGLKGAVDAVADDDGLPAVPQAALAAPRKQNALADKPQRDVAQLKADRPQAGGGDRRRLRLAAKVAANQAQGIAAAGDVAAAISMKPTMVAVREYAHRARPNRSPNDRVDFTETLYWNAGIRTDAKTGEAVAEFALSDSVTSFRVSADAFGPHGQLGASTVLLESVEPFYVEPKLPLEVTSGDVIQLPLNVVNSTSDSLAQVRLTAEAAGLNVADIAVFALAGSERARRILELDTTGYNGQTDVVVRGDSRLYRDSATRPLTVQPRGFPFKIARGGMLAAGTTRTHEIIIPQQTVPGSLTAAVKVMPSPMASMTESLAALIREPYGCFEQTSSSTYPLVMAQQYFMTHTGVDPKLIARSNQMLEKGYKRLVGFECKSGGYEWFGADPGHEALTAYGLLEFSDMAQVREVDQAMIARSRDWLLGRRDGKGGFKRERRALHCWLPDADVSNAYITWALLSAGERGLDREVDLVADAATSTNNSYVVALSANVLVLAGRQKEARTLLDRLMKLQNASGVIDGATKSIVGSTGQALQIETTALATLAWLSDLEYIDFADKGIRYLSEVSQAGRYGSTQSTVLALKAIVAFDKALAHPKSAGSLRLFVDGRAVGRPMAFDQRTQGAIVLPDIAKLLTPGKHTVAVAMTDGSSMPHTVAIDLTTLRPNSSDACDVSLDVRLSDTEVREGEITEARVICRNRTQETIPTPIAIIGIPGGLEVRHDQLKELVKSGAIAAYEVVGREVRLYWRGMAAGHKQQLVMSLVAAVPGQYTGPASRAYLYYSDEHKQWTDPLRVTIQPHAVR